MTKIDCSVATCSFKSHIFVACEGSLEGKSLVHCFKIPLPTLFLSALPLHCRSNKQVLNDNKQKNDIPPIWGVSGMSWPVSFQLR